MATPSVRRLTAAAWALLDGHPTLQAFQSIADNPALDTSGRLAKGYAVLHPSGGDTLLNDQARGNLAVTPGQLLWAFQIDAVGSAHDLDQLGWVIDTVRGLLDGRTLTVDGARVGLMQPPLGYQPPPPRPQFQAQAERLSVPLQYQVLAVTT